MAIDINKDNLEKEILKAQGIIVADFWAPWCGPCHKLGPETIFSKWSANSFGFQKWRAGRKNVRTYSKICNN